MERDRGRDEREENDREREMRAKKHRGRERQNLEPEGARRRKTEAGLMMGVPLKSLPVVVGRPELAGMLAGLLRVKPLAPVGDEG